MPASIHEGPEGTCRQFRVDGIGFYMVSGFCLTSPTSQGNFAGFLGLVWGLGSRV